MSEKDFWKSHQKILVILAHPDDPEFFCGATIAKWTKNHHDVIYCLLTKGEKGINKSFADQRDIVEIRKREQRDAASELGVSQIFYLDNEDGYLYSNISLRKEIVKIIRQIKPDVIVTCDPTNFYIQDYYINHPDHRTTGQVVLDAIFPAAQNPLFFPELLNENLDPHEIKEVWITLAKEPNLRIDVTEFWHKKISALLYHKSQIGNEKKFIKRMMEKHTDDSDRNFPRYEESFVRIVFRTQ